MSSQPFVTITTAGAILPADMLTRIAAGSKDLPGSTAQSYGLAGGEKIVEAASRAWNTLLPIWKRFSAGIPADASRPFVEETRRDWLVPLLRELGFGAVLDKGAFEVEGTPYQVSHRQGNVPIHLLGVNVPLDRRSINVAGAAQRSPHSLLQELLNRSPQLLWGIVSNGRTLRLLRDNSSLSRQAYVEFDLEAMFSGEAFSDFQLLWQICHATRFALPPEGSLQDCWLEKWSNESAQLGLRALGELRRGVVNALDKLGTGFLKHPANNELRARLRAGELDHTGYYRQLLRVVYRLLFLNAAEERGLLLDLKAPLETRETYTKYFSASRLRRLSQVRGARTPHSDLWQQHAMLCGWLGRAEGCHELALPSLGGLLFSAPLPGHHDSGAPDLDSARLRNADLLAAVEALSFMRDKAAGHQRRPVNFRELGAEELGGVYESLLEQHPRIDEERRLFSIAATAGSERKTSGSYYTPSSLIASLLDTALEPVIEARLREAQEWGDKLSGSMKEDSKGVEASKGVHADRPHWVSQAEAKLNSLTSSSSSASSSHSLTPSLPDSLYSFLAEAAILDLKVVDPACGSGHFLVGAAHRIGERLARIRDKEVEPSPESVRTALRDVIGHCIYGVDLNPMSVELCKVGLWLEALEPGKPLSFLDSHIRTGNSLLGTTREFVEAGIPDEAYTALAGDIKADVSRLKKLNAKQRGGQGALMFAEPWDEPGNLAGALARLDSMPEDTPEQLAAKRARHAQMVEGADYVYTRFAFDMWCSAFVIKKGAGTPEITSSDLYDARKNPKVVEHGNAALFEEVRRLAREYRFFHWELEFAHVFSGDSPGFDVVLGNPPWERIKLQEKEFFALREPSIAEAKNKAERGRMIKALKDSEGGKALHAEFVAAGRRAEGESHLIRRSGLYPLCGRGDVNTYAVFAERMRILISPNGRMGVIVPTGIATDDTTKFFFQDLVTKALIDSLFAFDYRSKVFPGVSKHYCVISLRGENIPNDGTFEMTAELMTEMELIDLDRRYKLSAADIALLNPNTRTCPVFRNRRDAELTKAIYRRVPVLVDETRGVDGNSWGVEIVRHFDMNRSEVLAGTFRELVPNSLPVYEAKLFHQFNHRFSTYLGNVVTELSPELLRDPMFSSTPSFWIQLSMIKHQHSGRWKRSWLLAFRDITNSTNERTLIASILPTYGTDYTVRTFMSTGIADESFPYLGATLNSYVLDYVSRQKIGGTHLSNYISIQLPVLPPSTYDKPCPWDSRVTLGEWIAPRVLELTYTAWDMQPFARDMGYEGPPFVWDEARRFKLRCELDSAYFHLYGIERADVDYIMDTFPIVRKKDEAAWRLVDGQLRSVEELMNVGEGPVPFHLVGEGPVPSFPDSDSMSPLPAGAGRVETGVPARDSDSGASVPLAKPARKTSATKKAAQADLPGEPAYRTKIKILSIYDAMLRAQTAGSPYETILNPPPADPSVGHEV